MLSDKQKRYYWVMWQAACEQQGWRPADDDQRYAVHEQAKCPQSMRDFRSADLNKFGRLCGRLTNMDMDREKRRQLVWRIRHDTRRAGLSESYVEKIAFDLKYLGHWWDLSLSDLTNLRNTIHNRVRQRSNSGRAGSPNPPKPQPADCPF